MEPGSTRTYFIVNINDTQQPFQRIANIDHLVGNLPIIMTDMCVIMPMWTFLKIL